MRLQPAWLVSADDCNPYNEKTRRILAAFEGIPIGSGNVVFGEGSAKRYLGEYLARNTVRNPYEEDPFDLRCLSVSPNGHVAGGNLYENSVGEILARYHPAKTDLE